MKLSISQNFLSNKQLIHDLVKKSGFSKKETILDIGAGEGIIAKELATISSRVLAFELDKYLFDKLKETVKDFNNVETRFGNFLDFPLKSLGSYKVFSNIPFSITSDIMTKLFFHGNTPDDAFLILQKEAALRYMGKRDNTLISLLLQPWFRLTTVYNFKPTDFSPIPSVETVLLRVRKMTDPEIEVHDMEDFRHFVIYALNQQKPTLKARLTKVFSDVQFTRLAKDLGFSKDIQASKVSLNQWIGLFRYYKIGVEGDKKLSVASVGNAYMHNLRKFSGVSSRKN